ncbi:MAG: hypothetical protein SVX43_23975 [Cyanobacteriota bacterium]|nr:hypothetical protein [Cyanobacteriota bacterium]
MSSPTQPSTPEFARDREVWDSLKRAIASSSGFQRWQLERQLETAKPPSNLESQIRNYLRETLETLAY